MVKTKKAQIPFDWLVFFLFVIFFITMSLAASLVLIPNSIERSKFYILQDAEDISNDLFIYGFLRQKIGSIDMADLIGASYMNQDYSTLEQNTIEILKNTKRNPCFEIYINEKEMPRESKSKCKGEEIDFLVDLPLPNKELINFRLVLYET